MEMTNSSQNIYEYSQYALEGLDLRWTLLNGTIPEAFEWFDSRIFWKFRSLKSIESNITQRDPF